MLHVVKEQRCFSIRCIAREHHILILQSSTAKIVLSLCRPGELSDVAVTLAKYQQSSQGPFCLCATYPITCCMCIPCRVTVRAVCYITEHVSKAHRTIQGKDYRAKPTTQQLPHAQRHVSTEAACCLQRRKANTVVFCELLLTMVTPQHVSCVKQHHLFKAVYTLCEMQVKRHKCFVQPSKGGLSGKHEYQKS
jgi:hypothetical protein